MGVGGALVVVVVGPGDVEGSCDGPAHPGWSSLEGGFIW